ncbi:DUF317 domain-containing protein [Streptomyces californicus]|uniref:DUF317 domain-containing protein n=1 Tax=Streptomyces californicus TaxID=67351 RepID=UPI003795C65E
MSVFRDLPSWHIETSEPRGEFSGPRIWHAYLDEHTPPHLVTSFLTALTNPSPLQRGMYERTVHYSAVQKPSPLHPQQVVDAHTTRISSLRTQARSASRQRTKPATTPANTNPARPAARR